MKIVTIVRCKEMLSIMKKYLLITLVKGSLSNAGPKAPLDICKILEETGEVELLSLSSESGMDYPLYLELMYQLKQRKEEQTVILQYPLQPFYYHDNQELYSGLLSLLNPDNTWIWIHDINHIRFDMECYKREMEWLKPFKNFIVHNIQMEEYLSRFLKIEKCIQNEIFDYLCRENLLPIRELKDNKNQKSIIYAGNLANSKSPFLYELCEENMEFQMNIYGKRETLIKNRKINYCGSFKADILPDKLRGTLGLIWDGQVDAVEDTSSQRKYTRYNAPHKFSCYMAAGLPVIAWKEAAIASVIEKYQVGYLIENIYDINNLDLSNYRQLCANVQKLNEKVRDGYFTKRVFYEMNNLN